MMLKLSSVAVDLPDLWRFYREPDGVKIQDRKKIIIKLNNQSLNCVTICYTA